jgi:hypothetical protein
MASSYGPAMAKTAVIIRHCENVGESDASREKFLQGEVWEFETFGLKSD